MYFPKMYIKCVFHPSVSCLHSSLLKDEWHYFWRKTLSQKFCLQLFLHLWAETFLEEERKCYQMNAHWPWAKKIAADISPSPVIKWMHIGLNGFWCLFEMSSELWAAGGKKSFVIKSLWREKYILRNTFWVSCEQKLACGKKVL